MATTNLRKITLGGMQIQSGNGVPNHSSTLGTLYTDIDTGIRYKNNLTTNWLLDVTSGGGGALTVSLLPPSGIPSNGDEWVTYSG